MEMNLNLKEQLKVPMVEPVRQSEGHQHRDRDSFQKSGHKGESDEKVTPLSSVTKYKVEALNSLRMSKKMEDPKRKENTSQKKLMNESIYGMNGGSQKLGEQ